MRLRAAVLTISDRCQAGTQADASGPAVAARLTGHGYEIVRREVLGDERAAIEARFEAHEKEKAAEKADPAVKKRKKRREPSVPELMQHNFTDPDSRIMKAGNGQHFE